MRIAATVRDVTPCPGVPVHPAGLGAASGREPSTVLSCIPATRASGLGPASRLPRSSLAPPEEPARAIAWLCTPAADPFAGQEIDIRHETFRSKAGLETLA